MHSTESRMKRTLLLLFLTWCAVLQGQFNTLSLPDSGFEERIRRFVDTVTVFSTHEHFMDPEIIKDSGFLDFAFLFIENGYNDMVSAGLNDSLFNDLFGMKLTPAEKWKIIEPYWKKSFNTANNRVLLRAINDLYGATELNSATAAEITRKMKVNYSSGWFDKIILEKSGIDYVIIDGDRFVTKAPYIKYSERFDEWIMASSKRVVDSLAIMQLSPIYTLEDFVKSLKNNFENKIKEGMVAVKIDMAYLRPIKFEKVSTEAARKIFKTLVNGNEDTKLSLEQARPLQDYMVYNLIELAGKNNIPVAFHTGFQAGNSNELRNSDPTLLTNLFIRFPETRFVLFHGSYPFGGELSALAKTFSNVYIDMNWTYDISPTYAEKFLGEWLETVPVSKIMAFGGDQRTAEMTYGSLIVARKVVADVLIEKVRIGYFNETEALNIARMILHDNAMKFYNISTLP